MKVRFLFIKFAFALTVFAALSDSVSAQVAPKQQQLLNGLKVLMWPDKTSDKVSVRIRVHSGAAFDQQGKEGTMQLLSDNLFPNAAAKEFFVEDLGGGLEVVTTYDYIQVNASSKPDQMLTMLETLASAISNPPIDKDTTATLKTALLAKIGKLTSDPAYVADRAVAERLLGTFPYGRPIAGTPDSVKRLATADLIDARQRFLTADNATITISGNFDPTLAFKAARRYFGSWLKADKRVPSTFRQPDDPPTALLTVASPQPGTAAIRAAFRGSGRGAKEFAAAEVFAKVLEDRLRARVPRENANAVSVRNQSYVQPGMLVISFSITRNEAGTGNGKVEFADLVPKAIQDTITDGEFQTARSAVASDWSKRSLEDSWLDVDTYRLASANSDRTAFDRVTLADVRDFSDRIRTDPVAMVLVNTPK